MKIDIIKIFESGYKTAYTHVAASCMIREAEKI